MDTIDVWSFDEEEPDAILTIVMDEEGDIAIIETILTDAGLDIRPCSCNE